ncbi:MAG TPA: hypothetical protein VJQ54_03495 [Candidatus Sulfotelmatobacter sp.]|nr:hypothetical protein [Candidatus Sulfotelmatobacter sp.]
MRRLTLILLTFLLSATSAFAQKRVEVGIFLDSLSISQTSTNNLGLGARVGFRVHQNVMLEGELAYDYGLNFDESYRNLINGDVVAIEHTSIGVTHGLFGPTLTRGGGHLHPFATLKAGFIDFRLSTSLLPYVDIVSPILNLRTSNLNAALYPGAGLAATLGPLGLRFEVGDEIYFNQGGHNNLRITFGPFLRF